MLETRKRISTGSPEYVIRRKDFEKKGFRIREESYGALASESKQKFPVAGVIQAAILMLQPRRRRGQEGDTFKAAGPGKEEKVMSNKMDPVERRRAILSLLQDAEEPMTGNRLAEQFSVTRQVIVQDIALLRAKNHNIIATPRGYLLAEAAQGREQYTLACQHGQEKVEEELRTIVSLGAKVIDVTVDHPLYGELKGMLMLKNQEDVSQFLDTIKGKESSLLCTLTEGVHFHNIEVINESAYRRIKAALQEEGFLLKD